MSFLLGVVSNTVLGSLFKASSTKGRTSQVQVWFGVLPLPDLLLCACTFRADALCLKLLVKDRTPKPETHRNATKHVNSLKPYKQYEPLKALDPQILNLKGLN